MPAPGLLRREEALHAVLPEAFDPAPQGAIRNPDLLGTLSYRGAEQYGLADLFVLFLLVPPEQLHQSVPVLGGLYPRTFFGPVLLTD
jgi:hypothetical protein